MLKKTSEAPYTTKLNYRVHTSRGTTREMGLGLMMTTYGVTYMMKVMGDRWRKRERSAVVEKKER